LFILSKILLTGVAPGSRHNPKKEWKTKCEEKYNQAMKEKISASAAEAGLQ
jgi:hypothetical protein